MATSISDPFLLASYDLPRSSSSTHPHVLVTYHNQRITATVQGDGVHLLDLESLHPIASHSLGPASRFGCPSVTRGPNSKSSEESATTYMFLQSESQIRRWTGGALGKPLEEGPAVHVENDISRLYAPNELPTRLITISTDGHVSLLDEQTLATVASHPASSNLLKTFLFPRADWAPNTSEDGVVLILFLKNSDEQQIQLKVISICDDDDLSELYTSKIPLELEEETYEIADISLTPSGHLSLLTTTGSWHAYHLSPSSPTPSPLGPPLHLTNLSFISSPPSPHLSKTVALLGLTDSHVLLVSPSSSLPSETVCMIWDLKFGVLLASRALALAGRVALEAAGGHAVAVLSPGGKEGKGRSVVLVVPYAVPARSTIRNALGKGAAGAKWLKQPQDQGDGEGLTEGERAVLEGQAGVNVEAVRKLESEQGEQGLSDAFVKAVLDKAEGEYAAVRETVRYLLGRGVVSAGMLEGRGLLEMLRGKDDWVRTFSPNFTLYPRLIDHVTKKAIELALDTVPDLGEADLVSLLLPPAPAPALLTHIVVYSTSGPALRRALREALSSRPEALVEVLGAVEGWVQKGGRVGEGEGQGQGKKDLPPFEKVLAFLTALLDATFLTLLAHPPAHALLLRLQSHLQREIAFAEAVEELRVPLEPFVRAGKDKERSAVEEGDWRKRRKERFERRGVAVGVYQVEELVL
ncbi:hypothetical protein NEOLEDRAFT_1238811 [Neolentinus lepideus HHB14362 ss-1]|uniref:Uncharacterized protein n=1 Tax=Neolentinus lepideus HHB14362 ss-1 TaxID=1314782 RepID=A0A165V9J1_9AGAM|nr:hypothetical protein NEOLEDRAFT_1238811 [Neolentinus lepideus HHB14362 ss-1]